MFAVGDRAVGVTNDEDNGAHGTVTELFDDGCAVLLDKHAYEEGGNGLPSWFGFDELRKGGRMSKFSVGDSVVVVNKETAFTLRRGEVIDLREDQDFPVKVLLDEDAQVCFSPEELEFEHVYDELSKPSDEEVVQAHEIALSFSLDPNLVSSDEAVNHPSHYTRGKFEVIDVIEDSGVNYRLGNVLKYVLRCDHKHDDNGVQDLKKALWYLTREVEAREGKRG